MTLHILVIDDQIEPSETERLHFERAIGLIEGFGQERMRHDDYQIHYCSGQRREGNRRINDVSVALAALRQRADWAMVLVDMQFDSGELDASGRCTGAPGDESFGLEIEQALRRFDADLPLVRFTSRPQRELQEQQQPYLAKLNLDAGAFRLTLLRHGRLPLDARRRLLGVDDSVVLASPSMFDVYLQALEYAQSDDPVLILGESGSGKEVLAKFLHRHSAPPGAPFHVINVGAIPEHLVDAELFGHERGAFTGADRTRHGWFEQTKQGTLFLDEIGDMLPAHQLRLLRVLQERQFVRVGGVTPLPFEGRAILATHRNLPERITQGLFREDLYNRLTLRLTIPPLRERPEEVPLLAQAFLDQATARQGIAGVSLSDEAIDWLHHHSFRGNLRELEALMKHLATRIGHNQLVMPKDIQACAQAHRQNPPAPPGNSTGPSERAPAPTRSGLDALLDAVQATHPMPSEARLKGFKPAFESLAQRMMLRCAVACLERCRHPVSGKLRLLPAMRILTGDPELSGTNARRVMNEIRGHKRSDPLPQEELETLCADPKLKHLCDDPDH